MTPRLQRSDSWPMWPPITWRHHQHERHVGGRGKIGTGLGIQNMTFGSYLAISNRIRTSGPARNVRRIWQRPPIQRDAAWRCASNTVP
jgi:hypothetical protein